MKRREALGKITILSAGTLVLMTGVLEGCNTVSSQRTTLTENDVPLMDEIAETIIPVTATSPGAKAAKAGAYMLLMVNDCFSEKRKVIFIEGLNTFDEACRQHHKAMFTDLPVEQKKAFIRQLNREAQTGSKEEEHYFSMLKSLSINGYTTSEAGATKAFRYDPVPGRFQGCIQYTKGDKPWSAV